VMIWMRGSGDDRKYLACLDDRQDYLRSSRSRASKLITRHDLTKDRLRRRIHFMLFRPHGIALCRTTRAATASPDSRLYNKGSFSRASDPNGQWRDGYGYDIAINPQKNVF